MPELADSCRSNIPDTLGSRKYPSRQSVQLPRRRFLAMLLIVSCWITSSHLQIFRHKTVTNSVRYTTDDHVSPSLDIMDCWVSQRNQVPGCWHTTESRAVKSNGDSLSKFLQKDIHLSTVLTNLRHTAYGESNESERPSLHYLSSSSLFQLNSNRFSYLEPYLPSVWKIQAQK
jgi:hypothetical protein